MKAKPINTSQSALAERTPISPGAPPRQAGFFELHHHRTVHVAVLCASHDCITRHVANDLAGKGASRTTNEGAGSSIKCRDCGLKPAQWATAANQSQLRVSQFARSMTIF